jgi:mevalonate kinase
MSTASAPGKMLLMGDHAVVYNRPCIVTAVDTRLAVSIERGTQEGVHIHAPQVANTEFVLRTVEAAKAKWNVDLPSLSISTRSDFSSQYGLGSSSAVVVATLFALCDLLQRKDSLEELFLLARQVVLDVQGNGSGFDVAAAMFGGTLWYEKGGPTIERLNITAMPLVIGYTGTKADTKTLVTDVARKKEKEPEKVNRIFDAIGKLVEEAKVRIGENDWERVGKLFDFNQEYLRDLGVSSEPLESLIMAAKQAGAWGAKLSGAGGGDCMIALVSDDKRKAVEDAIRQAGGELVQIAPNAAGVRVEA